MFRNSRRALAVTMAILATGAAACTQSVAASVRTSGAEHFQVLITSPASFANGGRASLIATGAIGAGGVAVTDSYGKGWTATFKVHGGSFKVAQSANTGTQHLDKATCILTQHAHGTFTVTNGTGSYGHITGHGTYRLYWLIAMPRTAPGKCSFTAKPIAFQQIVEYSGSVSY